MKYCNKCGSVISDDSNFCSKCGTKFTDEQKEEYLDRLTIGSQVSVIKSFTDEQAANNKKTKDTPVIIWIIIGLLFPIIGAILYYVLKKTDYKAAKVLNICSWIGILIQGILTILYQFTV